MGRLVIATIMILLCGTWIHGAERPRPQRGGKPATQPAATAPAASAGETRVPLNITGGHETDPRDHGRPVVLVAAGLGVPEEVFRETFTHVRPSRNGPPDAELARRNKQALMEGLGKYGVTNDRLDEVSNFYRYNGSRGEMWKNTPAEAYSVVKNGAITSIVVSKPGAGYSSTPRITAPGFEGVELKATVVFDKDLGKNGAIKEIAVVHEPKK
jgi:hypothetical protein